MFLKIKYLVYGSLALIPVLVMAGDFGVSQGGGAGTLIIQGAIPSVGGGSGDFNSFQNPSTGPLNMSQFAVNNSSDLMIGNASIATFMSTTVADMVKYQNFSSTTDAALVAVMSTHTAFRAFSSTSDAQQTKFVNFRSTTDTALEAIMSTHTAFRAFTSTSDAQQNKFVNFNSTTDAALAAIMSTHTAFRSFASTSDARGDTFVNFRSSSDVEIAGKIPNTAAVIRSTHIAQHIDFTGAIKASSATLGHLVDNGSATIRDVIVSTTGAMLGGTTIQGVLMVEGGTIQVRNGTNEFSLVFATQPTAGQHLFVASVVGNRALIAGGGDNAGSAAGGGGGGSVFTFSPAGGNVAASTISIGGGLFNKMDTSGQGSSTFTVGTSTNPYMRLSIPAQSLRARPLKFGASDTGGGISITTNPGTIPDNDSLLTLDYFSFAPSTRQYAQFQFSLSSGGSNGWMIGSTMSWNYSGFVSSGAAAGKQVVMQLQLTCLGGNSNINTTAWGSSVAVNLPDITSNFIIRDSTNSASITLGGKCFGDSLILGRVSRSPIDGADNMGGATGQYFNLTSIGLFYRKSDMRQDDLFAR